MTICRSEDFTRTWIRKVDWMMWNINKLLFLQD